MTKLLTKVVIFHPVENTRNMGPFNESHLHLYHVTNTTHYVQYLI